MSKQEHWFQIVDFTILPLYRPIYSPEPIEFKTLKICIKTNVANRFIKALKSLAGAPILFVCKLNNSFYLYVSH